MQTTGMQAYMFNKKFVEHVLIVIRGTFLIATKLVAAIALDGPVILLSVIHGMHQTVINFLEEIVFLGPVMLQHVMVDGIHQTAMPSAAVIVQQEIHQYVMLEDKDLVLHGTIGLQKDFAHQEIQALAMLGL